MGWMTVQMTRKVVSKIVKATSGAMKINTTVAKPPTKRIIIAINAKGIATIDSKMRVIVPPIQKQKSSQNPLIIFLDKSDDQILTRCLFAENLIEF